jgi:hypothetical protein
MANPRDVTQCLGICYGVGLEVAPGHCCWPGQQWNIDREECFGPTLACPPHTRRSPQGECLSIDAPCESNLECDADSGCLAGRCVPARRFRRLELFADGALVALGSWSITDGSSTSSPALASGGFAPRGGMGLAVRAAWAIHPRWSLGPYLGYLRVFGGQVDVDQPNSLRMGSRSLQLSLVRLGGLVSYRWPVRRWLTAGVGLEGGLVFGTGVGATPVGPEIGPDFFLDVPLGSGTIRSYLTLSFGFRAGALDRELDLPDYEYAYERWYYVMPVVRVGVGVGR